MVVRCISEVNNSAFIISPFVVDITINCIIFVYSLYVYGTETFLPITIWLRTAQKSVKCMIIEFICFVTFKLSLASLISIMLANFYLGCVYRKKKWL